MENALLFLNLPFFFDQVILVKCVSKLRIVFLKNTTKSPERFIFYQFPLKYPKGSQPGGARHGEA